MCAGPSRRTRKMTTRFDIHISIDWTACKASQSDVFLRLRSVGRPSGSYHPVIVPAALEPMRSWSRNRFQSRTLVDG
jgi:hypothetical protein